MIWVNRNSSQYRLASALRVLNLFSNSLDGNWGFTYYYESVIKTGKACRLATLRSALLDFYNRYLLLVGQVFTYLLDNAVDSHLWNPYSSRRNHHKQTIVVYKRYFDLHEIHIGIGLNHTRFVLYRNKTIINGHVFNHIIQI